LGEKRSFFDDKIYEEIKENEIFEEDKE